MNFDRLRQLLIQKAIEGKLVPQLDTELPVQQIGSSPSNIPFAIPKKWKWERLDSVFTLQAGKFIAASEISSEGPYLCYGGNGIRGRVSLFNREGRFPLIGRQGALCGNINIADGKFYATEHAVVADSHGIMDADCAFFFLRYLNLNQYATQTAQPGLSVKKISAVGIPVPPLKEQHRIVTRLNELLSVIKQAEDAYTDLQSLGKTLRERILQKAIEGKLVPQIGDALAVALKNENTSSDRPFEIPYKWKWCKLKDIAVSFDYGTSEKCHNDKNVDDIAVLRMSNITRQGDIDFSNLKYCSANSIELPKLFAHQGDLLFNRTNSIDLVGKCAVYRGEESKFSFASYIIRVALKDCDPTFIAAYINSDICRQTQILPNTSQQVGQANFGGTKLKNVLVPIPPLEEQRRIVAKLNELLPLVDQMTAV